MSEEKKNGSPTGKSLALMQQRLLTKPQAEEAKEGPEESAPAAGNGGGQPEAAAAAQNRPKGKDFAAMAMNAKTTPAPAAPAPAAAAPLASNRPKGKDFAAMANRMPAVHPQDPARAAKMQAAARAAAGLPPLAQPTATSVTTVPPPITASVPAPRPGVPTAAPVAPAASYKPPQGTAIPKPVQQQGPTPMAVDVRPQSVPRAKLETKTVRRSSSGGQSRRTNHVPRQQVPPPAAAHPVVAAPAPKPAPKPRTSPKPTRQPTPAEARLSMSASALARSGGPHVSPLVGQRLRDLVASLDPNYALDAEAEEQVLQLADDFLDKVTRQSLRLAQHRGSRTLDVQDVQLALSKQWGIVVPGLGAPVLRPTKPANRASASGSGGTKRRASSAENSKSGATKKTKASGSTAASKAS